METGPMISKLRLSEAREDPLTTSRIEQIADESYTNALVLLAQEYHKNNEIYVYRDRAEAPIAAFFMVGWDRVPGIAGATVFLGLSSVADAQKGRGIGKLLYATFLNDALGYQRQSGLPVRWWFHTATPVVANSFWGLTQDVVPKCDGSYTDLELADLLVIKNRFGMTPFTCPEHPFVLRGYAKARYSMKEGRRIKDHPGSHLLSRLGVNEQNGDRLLFVGRVLASTAPSD